MNTMTDRAFRTTGITTAYTRRRAPSGPGQLQRKCSAPAAGDAERYAHLR